MGFKVKDLMIHILPLKCSGAGAPAVGEANPAQAYVGGGCGATCGCSCTSCTVCTTCTSCTNCTTHTRAAICEDIEDAVTLGHLALLKEQLKKALKEAEIKEQVVEETMVPKTLEQVEELEEKMTEALKELHEIKKKLGDQEAEPRQRERAQGGRAAKRG